MKISYMLVNNSGYGLSMPIGDAWHWIHEVDDEKHMSEIIGPMPQIAPKKHCAPRCGKVERGAAEDR